MKPEISHTMYTVIYVRHAVYTVAVSMTRSLKSWRKDFSHSNDLNGGGKRPISCLLRCGYANNTDPVTCVIHTWRNSAMNYADDWQVKSTLKTNFHFIHPRWCILSVINNLAIIVIHATYNNLLFTDFYDDMFRSLYDHLQVVSSNFGYSQPLFRSYICNCETW
jgi:hypothetical protein